MPSPVHEWPTNLTREIINTDAETNSNTLEMLDAYNVELPFQPYLCKQHYYRQQENSHKPIAGQRQNSQTFYGLSVGVCSCPDLTQIPLTFRSFVLVLLVHSYTVSSLPGKLKDRYIKPRQQLAMNGK